MALANSTVLRVPSTLTVIWLSASASRSYTAARWWKWSIWPLRAFTSSALTPSRLAVRSPKTGTARVGPTPQYSRSAATLASLSRRIRKCTTAPLRSSSFLTSRLPMKPVAPVTK